MMEDQTGSVELIATITSRVASTVKTYRSRNADGTVCDIVFLSGPFQKTAYCVQHETYECDGALNVQQFLSQQAIEAAG